jgi:hypothetical protein
MIKSLQDAWNWYQSIRDLAHDMEHLASCWDTPEWTAVMMLDSRLSKRSAAELRDMANAILDDLDDLAVLVLFSVFEASIRAQAVADVDREVGRISHVAILQAIEDLKDAIENGSFAKVTRAFKKMDTDLTAQIDQIRKYRNWVAHGRREEPENRTNPKDAFDRLGRYLGLLAMTSSPSDQPSAGSASSERTPET